MQTMKLNKKIVIGVAVAAALLLILVISLAYLGAFSGTSDQPRNQTLETAVAAAAEEEIQAAFDEESGFTLVSADVYARLYLSDYPADTEVTDALIRQIITERSESLVAEMIFLGDRIEFQDYKVFTYEVIEYFRTNLDWHPSALQLFYRRHAEAGEESDVNAYESQIAGYLFTRDESTIVNSTGTHYIIELSEDLEKKTKAYIVARVLNFVVISGTVIGLSTLWIVRKIKKIKKEKNKQKKEK